MIKNSLLTFGILFISWWIIVLLKPFSLFGHQWQENLIIAEKFIFDNNNVDNLILGSSLAKRLAMDRLPGFYNLAFSGQGVFDGLNVLKFSKKTPKNLFIEINVISRRENKLFNDVAFSPILNVMKKKIIAFRADKQPLSALTSFVLIPVIKKIEKTIRTLKGVDTGKSYIDNKATSIESDIFKQNIELQKKIYSKPIDNAFLEELNNQIAILDKNIQFLKSKGVRIIFFEMPISGELINLNRAIFVRKRIKEFFNRFDFIEIYKNIGSFKTTDGIHLKNDASIIYTEYFKNEAKKILSKQHRVLDHSPSTVK